MPYIARAERIHLMDFSTPVSFQLYGLLSPWPKEESRLSAITRPFQPMVTTLFRNDFHLIRFFISTFTSEQVWLGFCISTAFLVALMCLFGYFNHRWNKNTNGNLSWTSNLFGNVLYVLAVITGQGIVNINIIVCYM